MRTFVISDIHGDSEGLGDVLIGMFNDGFSFDEDQLIFLGDYVDGYAYSKDVIGLIRTFEACEREGSVIALKGNHEQMLIDGWDKPVYHPEFQLWWTQGGEATAMSYDIIKNGRIEPTDEFLDDIEWMKQLPYRYETEHHHFVHAGFRPEVPVKEQDPYDMLWIRYEFIDNDYDFGKPVVFGHTAVPKPIVTPTKIQMDTRMRGRGHVSGAELFADKPPVFYPK